MRFLSCIFLSVLSQCMLAQQTVGLFLKDSTASEGYVLFGNNEQSYLIDKCGRIVHQWQSHYPPGQWMYVLENGNLLRAARIAGEFDAGGRGGRFELFSWEGELLWHYSYADDRVHAHHDLAPLPNGNFLFTAWEKHSEQEAQAAGRLRPGPVWSEKIVELKILPNNKAEVVWEWRLWDHLIQAVDPALPNYGTASDHPGRVDINFVGPEADSSANWIHFNAIDYHPDLDQIVVSTRMMSEIWIIDHSTSTQEAASSQGGRSGRGGNLLFRLGNPQVYGRGGPEDQTFVHQHDIHWIPQAHPFAGHLMVFNNEYDSAWSRVEIWQPPLDSLGQYRLAQGEAYGPEAPVWTYAAPDFYSRLISGAQLLPNGHVFICEGWDGRIFELNSIQEIAWEYIVPVNRNGGPLSQGGTVRFNQTFRATHYPPDYPAFKGRDLSPGNPVEINPWESECYQPAADSLPPTGMRLLGNPVKDRLSFETFGPHLIQVQLIDLQSRVVGEVDVEAGVHHLPVSHLAAGLYLLQSKQNGQLLSTWKLLIY